MGEHPDKQLPAQLLSRARGVKKGDPRGEVKSLC